MIAGCGTKTNQQAGGAQAADPSAEESGLVVQAVPAEIRDIEVTIEGFGRCESLPQATAVLTPAIEGQIEQLLAKPGDTVKHGQAIVQLDDRIARANLAEKIANRDGLKASLELLEAPPRPEELKAQESAVEQAKVTCEKAQATVERFRPLATKGEIPGVQLSDAEGAAKQAMLQCDAAQAQLGAMKLGPRPEAIAEAQARITTADAQVDSAHTQLDSLTLRSPIEGVLDSLTCQLGQTISVGTTVGEVVDAKQLLVTSWLPANVAARVNVGQAAKVFSNPATKNRSKGASGEIIEVNGKVTFVGKIVDAQTGNLPVQITIDNADGRLSVGETVTVSITVDEKKSVLAVPVSAIFDVGDGSGFSIIRDGKSMRVQGELGVRDKQWVELVASELKPALHEGESVIVEGGYNLPDGTAVRTQEITKTNETPADQHQAKSTTVTSASQETAP